MLSLSNITTEDEYRIIISDAKSVVRRNVRSQRDWDHVYCLLFCSAAMP